MRILVTGSEGYIGTVLVPMLMERGHAVKGIDAGFVAHRHFVPGIRRYSLMRKDIRDLRPGDLKGFDAVLHLAALSNDPMGEINPDITEAINHQATVNIAEMAKAEGVRRFIFYSSCSIYGAGSAASLDENAPFNPLTAYARSKVDSERDLRALASDSFSPVFLRNGTAYGLSPRMRFDLVLNNLTAYGVTTGKVTLLSDGTAWRPLVHIRDINLAAIAALSAPRELIHNEAFNVGVQNANYQIRTLANRVAETVPDSAVSFSEGVESDKRNYNVCFDKIHSVLKNFFTPTWDIGEGIEEVYHACRVSRLNFTKFDSPEYMTIKGLKRLISDNKLDAEMRWRN